LNEAENKGAKDTVVFTTSPKKKDHALRLGADEVVVIGYATSNGKPSEEDVI
jgi:D-arabinose 1-dehydrogenase-like Zn-dependent alcohol dehydrogenase